MDEQVAKSLKNRFEEELIRKEKQLDETKQKIDDLDSQKDWLDWNSIENSRHGMMVSKKSPSKTIPLQLNNFEEMIYILKL